MTGADFSLSDGVSTPVEIGSFASAALEMRAMGLAVMPVGGNDGKSPMITGFTRWRGPPAVATVQKWLPRFGAANIGISCGPSRIAVIDVDDANLLERVLSTYGDTPLIVRTARGYHCYYRDTNHTSSMQLRAQGLAIDVKAKGGFVVAPPSLIPGRSASYQFERGDWIATRRLPTLAMDALARLISGHVGGASGLTNAVTPSTNGRIQEGARNNALFTHLRAYLPFNSRDDAIEEATLDGHHQ